MEPRYICRASSYFEDCVFHKSCRANFRDNYMKTLHEPIHKECIGCLMIMKLRGDNEDYEACSCYISPTYWWETSGGRKCPIATHLSDKTRNDTRTRATIKGTRKPTPPLVPKSKDWPKSGIKTPNRFSSRKGRD